MTRCVYYNSHAKDNPIKVYREQDERRLKQRVAKSRVYKYWIIRKCAELTYVFSSLNYQIGILDRSELSEFHVTPAAWKLCKRWLRTACLSKKIGRSVRHRWFENSRRRVCSRLERAFICERSCEEFRYGVYNCGILKRFHPSGVRLSIKERESVRLLKVYSEMYRNIGKK